MRQSGIGVRFVMRKDLWRCAPREARNPSSLKARSLDRRSCRAGDLAVSRDLFFNRADFCAGLT